MDETHPSAHDDIPPLFPRADGPLLTVTLDVAEGAFRFEWTEAGGRPVVARGRLGASGFGQPFHVLVWEADHRGLPHRDRCGTAAPSTRALLKRIRAHLPESAGPPRVGVVVADDLGPARAGQ